MLIPLFHCETAAKSLEVFHRVLIVLDGLDLMEHDVRRLYRWCTKCGAKPSHPRQIDNVNLVRNGLSIQFNTDEFVNDLTVPSMTNTFCCDETCFITRVDRNFNSED